MITRIKSLAVVILTVAILVSSFSLNAFAANSNTAVAPKAQTKTPLKPKVSPVPTTKPVKKAVPAVKPTLKPIPTPAPKNVFMWEISSKDATSSKKVYLLGSVHVGSKSNFPLDKRIEDSFAKSDALVVEADMSKLTQEKAMEYLTKYGTFKAPDSLKNKISPELYKKLGEELKKLNVPMGPNIDAAKPWLLASQLTTLKAMQSGYDANLGIDIYFTNKAKDKKEILELESADFQLNMLSGLSDKLQETFLDSSLDSKEYVKDMIDKMYKAWRTGDTKSLEELMMPKDQTSAEYEELNDIIIYQRNITMAQKIEEYLADSTKNYFVIAGSGHMIGQKGIVNLLIEKGYKVRQM